MRYIGTSFSDLAEGYAETLRLTADLKARWQKATQSAAHPTKKMRERQEALAAERLAAWEREKSVIEQEYEARLKAWKTARQEREKRFEAEWTAWGKQISEWEENNATLARSSAWRTLGLLSLIAALLAFPVVLSCACLFTPYVFNVDYSFWSYLPCFLVILVPICFWVIVALLVFLFRPSKEQKPQPPKKPYLAGENIPPAPAIPSRPIPAESFSPPKESAFPDIEKEWFSLVKSSPAGPEQETHGRPGEVYLLETLSSLPDDYIGIPNLLVDRSLDVDALVIGPSGVYLLDSKFWHGSITAENGVWSCERFYSREAQTFPDVEAQWERQKRSVAAILKRLRRPSLAASIHGGLSFTHFESHCIPERISSTLKYGTPGEWKFLIQNAPNIEGVSFSDLLQAVDALLQNAVTLSGQTPLTSKTLVLEIYKRAEGICASLFQDYPGAWV